MPGIDLHTHLAPAFDRALAPPHGVAWGDDGRLLLDGRAIGPADLERPERLLAALDRWDLDAAAVSPPPPCFRQQLDVRAAADWTAALNRGLLAAAAGSARLLPLAYLPLEHPQLAIESYASLRSDRRWSGVCGSAGGRSTSLADARLAPLWRMLDEDEALLLLHPGTSPDARLERFYLANLLGNPVETALAAAELVFGDVLARHPRMRVLLVHCGGCVPALVGRWERGAATARPGIAPLRETPRQAVRRLWADCLAHDRGLVDLAAATFGEERLVLGSDWPFPMGADDPRDAVAHRGAAFARRVAVDNARAALGGRHPAPGGRRG